MEINLNEVIKNEDGNSYGAYKEYVIADSETKKIITNDAGQAFIYKFTDLAEEITFKKQIRACLLRSWDGITLTEKSDNFDLFMKLKDVETYSFSEAELKLVMKAIEPLETYLLGTIKQHITQS